MLEGQSCKITQKHKDIHENINMVGRNMLFHNNISIYAKNPKKTQNLLATL